ncbi:E3 ubiquitin-protein ligase XIAP [Syngnathus typhle]|uniref:E3 ubiquitin-protein ligase XIAP n=1 Tax=Syngnathus typhle TaxID=161592 RepID=UPI002A6A7090|nr:E3 ubiquitin-protein ligase XIAP [Syngnathus typhle]XP_061130114.1 E3 ubiquitin-protein ligase XIAP [Syngnathus typhle]XP_061130123.1 E3 ubiquitin-protein ligase XIAP [Syngnathus typhle]
MSDLTEDGVLESDFMADYSQMSDRLHSFNGSTLAEQVPPERLARAGFYYTGPADRVRCFSCRMNVENWCRGDIPVERHKEVSPLCTFLSCTHRTNFQHSTQLTGSRYNEVDEDMEYRLRTGEVVDESTYPMVPHMRREEARRQTFSTWPPTAPVTPSDLAQAGLYYLGQGDRVQCFCCGGMLGGWEAEDTPWGEHSKHFPTCFFVLGHDVGNVPAEGGTGLENPRSAPQGSTYISMGSFQERLRSFAGIQHPIDHVRLARAGFYSTGERDMVMCFHCEGGLKGWAPDEDPWEEHAKSYPGCRFVLAEKGLEFINTIQLQGPQQNKNTSSHQNGFTAYHKDDDPLETIRKLQREKQCKVCMDRDTCVVFIPCGHLATCEECSQTLTKCPICCGAITQKVKTYIA